MGVGALRLGITGDGCWSYRVYSNMPTQPADVRVATGMYGIKLECCARMGKGARGI